MQFHDVIQRGFVEGDLWVTCRFESLIGWAQARIVGAVVQVVPEVGTIDCSDE